MLTVQTTPVSLIALPASIGASLGARKEVGRWTLASHTLPALGEGASVVSIRSTSAGAPEPMDWLQRLGSFFTLDSALVAVGAKRLMPDGHVFSMGEFVIHPKGFHHHGKGVDGRCYRFPEEADVVAGGVLLVRTSAFDAAIKYLGGLEALAGDLGLIQLGLALRHAGGRIAAAPQVVVTDHFTPMPRRDEHEAFLANWGFDWRLPDLDVVRERYAGSGLLWNTKYLAPGMPFEKYRDRGALVWESYEKAEVFRQRAHHLAQLVQRHAGNGPVLDLGCGDGFFSHLFAQRGLDVIGVDPEELGVAQAQHMTASRAYPGPRPTFRTADGTRLPFENGHFALVTNFDVIEHLPNPIALLREAARVLRPGGHFIVVSPAWQFGGSSDAVYHGFEYTMEELGNSIQAVDGLDVVDTGMIQGVYRDLIVIAKRV